MKIRIFVLCIVLMGGWPTTASAGGAGTPAPDRPECELPQRSSQTLVDLVLQPDTDLDMWALLVEGEVPTFEVPGDPLDDEAKAAIQQTFATLEQCDDDLLGATYEPLTTDGFAGTLIGTLDIVEALGVDDAVEELLLPKPQSGFWSTWDVFEAWSTSDGVVVAAVGVTEFGPGEDGLAAQVSKQSDPSTADSILVLEMERDGTGWRIADWRGLVDPVALSSAERDS